MRASTRKTPSNQRAELELLREAEGAEQRRMQVVLHARRRPGTPRPAARARSAWQVQARHLVLVLVGHELEEVARDRLADSRVSPGTRPARPSRTRCTNSDVLPRVAPRPGRRSARARGSRAAARSSPVGADRVDQRPGLGASARGVTADRAEARLALDASRAQAGSTTSRRPARKACVFIVTDTPLSAIASSMAAALTGMAPAW